MSEPLLEARDVTVQFGGLRALDAANLVVPDHGFVGLMGPNGAGKSTLFSVLSGLLRPRSGVVLIDGVDVTKRSPQFRAGRGLARTFQRLELFGELTVREHLTLARRIGTTRRPIIGALFPFLAEKDPEESAEIDGLLELLGLTALADVGAHTLPLGSGRLVEVARALASSPRVLLLDEPSSGLDDAETERLAAALRLVHQQSSLALVLVEHNVELVLGLAERVMVLDFGQVIAEGTAAEIRSDPAVQSAYLGTLTT